MIKQITFVQASNDDKLYIVDSLVNRIGPQVGTVLNADRVHEYVTLRDTKVIIKRVKT